MIQPGILAPSIVALAIAGAVWQRANRRRQDQAVITLDAALCKKNQDPVQQANTVLAVVRSVHPRLGRTLQPELGELEAALDTAALWTDRRCDPDREKAVLAAAIENLSAKWRTRM